MYNGPNRTRRGPMVAGHHVNARSPEPTKPPPGTAAPAAEDASAASLPHKNWLPALPVRVAAKPVSASEMAAGTQPGMTSDITTVASTTDPGTAPAFLAPAAALPAPKVAKLEANAKAAAAGRSNRGARPALRGHATAHGTSGLLNLLAFAGLGLLALGFADRRFGPDIWSIVLSPAAQTTAQPAAASQATAAASAPVPPPRLPTQPVTEPPVQSQPQPQPQSQAAAAPVVAPVGQSVVPAVADPQAARSLPTAPEAAPGSPPPVIENVAAPTLLAAELQHVARFDALIAPVRDALPSYEDAARLRDAMSSLQNINQTRALRDHLNEPAARKLIDWQLARGGNGTAREIKTFLDENPAWPSRDTLVQRAEEQLFVSGGSAREIKSFFDKSAPKTGIGMAALASAFLAEGDEAQATQLASDAWRRTDIAATLETGFLDRFGRLLKEADHKARFDRYMIDNTRWTNDRAERAATARRILPYLSEPERKKAEARLAVYLRLPAADALLAALPADAATVPSNDWGFAFQLAQWNRRAGRLDATLKVLADAPTDASTPGSLDEWWEERRISAYEALKTGKPQVAYDIVKTSGALGPNAQKDHDFLAGWIAQRYLNAPAVAEGHFAALEAVADGPQSRARGAYWLARAYEAQGLKDKMRAPLERAARNIDTFYGQLARLELDPAQTEIKITPPRTPTPEEAQRFNSNELVRAAVLSRKSNLEPSVTRALLIRLSQTLDTEAEQGLLAHLAEALGDTQMAVRIGKSAVARGYNLLMYSYPIHAMPTYASLRPSPEAAMMLGIARQESEFSTAIVSGAGARGLMQVMPVTAQHVCRDYKIKCDQDRVGRDPAYNAMMASAYIADRMDEFAGSYVLTIAGYNAGPGRARQWIKEFGDPRTAAINPTDWIQRIPFEETREYVQKVLSNMQIYRARLGQEKDALRLTADLRRTAPAAPRRGAANAALVPGTAAPQNN